MVEKQYLANTIKDLVEQLRQQLVLAEQAGLTVELDYPSLKWAPKRELSVSIIEAVTY